MVAEFDPYHRWLSIPPSEQPPNHYRLLGLQAFESSVEVIENAASRQSTHVRLHLQSPLRPYAINLIRELEVARLCLSDGEAKRAYDAWLRQRVEYRAPPVPPGLAQATSAQSPHPATPGLADNSDNAQGQMGFERTGQFASPVAIVPSFVASRRRRRSKSKSTPMAFVFFWLTSGAIGLLAGYAVLCMIDPKYDFLHVMFDKDQRLSIGAERLAGPPIAASATDRENRSRPVAKAESRRQRVPSLQVESNNIDEFEPKQVAIRPDSVRSDRANPVERSTEQNEEVNSLRDLTPNILPFDLKKRIIRIVTIPENLPSENLFCNVRGSTELGLAPLIDFPLGGKRDLLFDTGINGVIVGIEVSFFQRNHSIVVEIRPKYRLPSGDEEAFYKTAGIKKIKLLSNQVSVATTAQRSLPAMQSRLSSVTTEYQSVNRIANTPTSSSGYPAQVAAQRRAEALFKQGAELEEQINAAESLVAQLSRLGADLAAIQKLGDWGAKISESAALAVSIHHDGVSLAAEAK